MAKTKEKTLIIHLMWGLPASGKTTFCETCNFDTVIDCDKIVLSRSKKDPLDRLVSKIEESMRDVKTNDIALDGLFTTNDQVDKLFGLIIKKFSGINVKFRIYFWEEDRDACLYNDLHRTGREKRSLVTIKNADFEKPSKELLKKYNMTGRNVFKKEVIRRGAFEIWIEKLAEKMEWDISSGTYCDIDKTDWTLKSARWSLGGRSNDCWGGSYSIDPDTPPESFNLFDDLLTEICPNVSFLIYKKLYNNTVNVESYRDYDYYGGSESYNWYSCDLQELYRYMKDMDLIQEEVACQS